MSSMIPEPEGVNSKTQLLCAWAGPLAQVLWVAGFWLLARWIPPPSPSDDPLAVQTMYLNNLEGIRAGMLVATMGAALLGPFSAALATQMKRIEGRNSPLAYTQLGLGMVTILLFVIPCFVMEAAAFRPERNPVVMQALNDVAWLPFVGAYQTTFIQLVAVAICIFRDTRLRLFPRWLGYFTLWVALSLVPAGFCVFLKIGPFAWNGFLAFWLALAVFCGWFITMFIYLRKAILTEVRSI